MRRIRTMVASAGAAALTTLAVVAAVPAIGADGAAPPTADGAAPPTADALAACLRAHGLDGAPDGDALKDWLGPRLNGDATAKRALDACAPQHVVVEVKEAGPPEQVRSCLKDHGIEVPAGDDPIALKRWIGEHADEAATAAALKACDIGPPVAKSGTGVCREPGPVTAAGPAKPDDKADNGQAPTTNGGASAGT
jgi:hypothetical protein